MINLEFINDVTEKEIFSSYGNTVVPSVGDEIQHSNPTYDNNHNFKRNVTTNYTVVHRKFIFDNNKTCTTVQLRCDKI